MHTYTITATRNNSDVHSWGETDKRRACAEARGIAMAYGATIDDVYVTEAGGRTIYHLRREIGTSNWNPAAV